MAFQLLDDLSASVQYENLYPHSYSPSGPQDNITSNVELPPSGYTSHNSNQHSSASRPGTEFIRGECGENRPFDHYAVNSHGHHALYPVGRPQIDDAPRSAPHHSHSPQSWPPYEGTTMGMSVLYDSFPSPSPFPPPRLSPPPLPMNGGLQHARTLAGSLDPATGIFYRTPEHPRLRTAQACEKCRTRKAKVRWILMQRSSLTVLPIDSAAESTRLANVAPPEALSVNMLKRVECVDRINRSRSRVFQLKLRKPDPVLGAGR